MPLSVIPPLKLYLDPLPAHKDGWYTVIYTGSFHVSFAEDANGQLLVITVRQHGDGRDFPANERNRQAIKRWQQIVCN